MRSHTAYCLTGKQPSKNFIKPRYDNHFGCYTLRAYDIKLLKKNLNTYDSV